MKCCLARKGRGKGGLINSLLSCYCCDGSVITRCFAWRALLHLDENILAQIFLTCDCCVTMLRDILNGLNEYQSNKALPHNLMCNPLTGQAVSRKVRLTR